jgi:hypothetical protein
MSWLRCALWVTAGGGEGMMVSERIWLGCGIDGGGRFSAGEQEQCDRDSDAREPVKRLCLIKIIRPPRIV